MKQGVNSVWSRISRYRDSHSSRAAHGFAVAALALFLMVAPNPTPAATVERSCEGAEMIKYRIDGKNYELTGAFRFTGKGTSKGTVPSPTRARERACKVAAQMAADAINEKQLLNQVCKRHGSASGHIEFMGGIGKSRDERQTQSRFVATRDFRCQGGTLYQDPLCGNGIKEGAEECDAGANNSDSTPNACRTDCRRASCGDAVVDRGEQCDAGPGNNDEIPGACRTSCKRAACGDGVLDVAEGEMCDDGNNDPYDGCHQCRTCIQPKDNLSVNQDARLCAGDHRIADAAQDGAIRVTGTDVTLDCRDSRLIGVGGKGTGIVVTGSNVVVRNCDVRGFGVGIDVRGENTVVFDAQACGNGVDVKNGASRLFAARNRCAKVSGSWNEGGTAGCSARCQ